MKTLKRLPLVGLIVLMFSLQSFAQDKTQGTVKVTKEKIYSDVKEALTGMAQALKVGANHVYEVLIRQQFVKSITNILCFSLGFLMIIASFKIALNLKQEDDNWDETIALIPLIVGVILTICLLVGSAINMEDTVMGFVNPEYGALKDIMHFIKK